MNLFWFGEDRSLKYTATGIYRPGGAVCLQVSVRTGGGRLSSVLCLHPPHPVPGYLPGAVILLNTHYPLSNIL